MQTLSVGKKLDKYTGVIIHAGQDSAGIEKTYTAGNDTGYVLEFSDPRGSQTMAENILANLQLRGVRYQPYTAEKAYLDPAAELGDNISVNGVSSFIARRNKKFGRLMATDISAPFQEEINHEYKYESKARREFKRESAYTRSRLTIAEDSIEAKVSKISPAGQESFSWVLVSDSHTWYANGNEVMRVNKNGLKVTGEVIATSGTIGGCSIVNGVLQVDAADIRHINAQYIDAGTLSVDRIANSSITGGENGKIAQQTITQYNTGGGINTNLGYAADYHNAISSTLSCYSISASGYMYYQGYTISISTLPDGRYFLRAESYGS